MLINADLHNEIPSLYLTARGKNKALNQPFKTPMCMKQREKTTVSHTPRDSYTQRPLVYVCPVLCASSTLDLEASSIAFKQNCSPLIRD